MDLSDPRLNKRQESDLRFITNVNDQYPTGKTREPKYWMIWTAKEAIFKARRELYSFDPKAITVKCQENFSSFSSEEIQGFWIVKDDSVIAVCSDSEDTTYHIYESDQKNKSMEIRQKIIDDYREKGELVEVLRDDDGLPILYNMMTEEKIQLSISHHHHMMGYAHT